MRTPEADRSSAVGKAVLACALAILACAAPAEGAELDQLGCLGPSPGCTPIRGVSGSFAAEFSHDGRTVYLTGGSSIAVFARDPDSGALGQLDAGPYVEDAGLLRDLVVSPDDRHVYAVFEQPDSSLVVAYTRDPATGALTVGGWLSGPGALAGLSISPDGRHLYVTSELSRTIAVLARDPLSGALTAAGCLSRRRDGPCTHVAGPLQVSGLSLSADGRNAYAATTAYCPRRCRPGTVRAFSRDASTGMLTPLPGRARCVRNGGRGGCRRGRDMFDPIRTFVSADGRNVYATGSESLTVYRRDATTGALRQLGRRVRLHGLHIPVHLTVAGTRAYLGSGDGAIAVLRRTASGRLIQLECISRRRRAGCERGRISPLPFSVRLSPDGRHAYVGGERVVGVFRAGPAAPPAPG